jgi:hypothetical protein
LSGTEIDRDYDTASSNKNKINTIPYERRRDAKDSDGTGVTDADAVKSYSQSQAEIFKVALYASFSTRLTHAGNSAHLAEAILSDSVRRHE